ncbi:MFS general substrate transporter [Hymenopellis radicata]|nr:MFS general substrate transporter [Hymenopellis radicata]
MTDTGKHVSEMMEDYEKGSIRSGSTGQPRHAGIDDEVANFFAAQSSAPVVIDDETNRRLRWMVHKRVLVVMVVTYFAQSLDKGTMSFASIMGIKKIHTLLGNNTPVYIAILAWEFPTNRLLQRLPIAKYLSFNIMAWGAVLACTAACNNFAGLVVVRTLWACSSVSVNPPLSFCTCPRVSTMWYTRDEQALVIGSFYSMNGFQQCVGGLIAYGIAQIHHAKLKNWQILFTLLGCVTFVWGLFVGYWLPDSPMRAKCWSQEDRILIAERVRKNETGIQNKEFKMHQAVEAFKDLTVWAIVLISFTNALPTGGIGAFSNIILTAFGFTVLQTYLLAIAQGVIIMLFLFSAAYLSKKLNQKLLLAFLYTLPNVAGTIVFMTVQTSAKTKVGLLLAFYCTQGFGAVATLNLAVMSGNIAGRTKQVVASTLVFVAWAVGNAIGPQVFRSDDAPKYYKAWVSHIVMYGVQLAAIAFLRARLMRLNVLKRRAQKVAETKASGEDTNENITHSHAFDDLTDHENPDFRYVY